MKIKNIKNHKLGIVLLVCLMCFSFVSPSVAQKKIAQRKTASKKIVKKTKAQTTKYQKIDYIIFLGKDSLEKEETENKIGNVFAKCPLPQQKEILAYMVKAITDSLNANNKQSAMDCIDNYRMLASPDDEYLGSLVITQGKYYYDKMDAAKLYELQNYINGISTKSKLDYSSEIAEITNLYKRVLYGRDAMLGYWVADVTGKHEKANGFFLHIYKDSNLNYHSDVNYFMEDDYIYYTMEESTNNHFKFSGIQKSEECEAVSPNKLAYCWTSDKLSVGKEFLASALRAGTRTVSNSIIGELARSNSHSFATTIMGSVGSIAGEIFLNLLIDRLSVSKKKIRIIAGEITSIDKNNLHATIKANYYSFRSDKSNVEEDSCMIHVNLIRYDTKNDDIRENVVFMGNGWLSRPDGELPRKERKALYERNPNLRKRVRSVSRSLLHPFELARKFNREQLIKLKEYNGSN